MTIGGVFFLGYALQCNNLIFSYSLKYLTLGWNTNMYYPVLTLNQIYLAPIYRILSVFTRIFRTVFAGPSKGLWCCDGSKKEETDCGVPVGILDTSESGVTARSDLDYALDTLGMYVS